MSLTLPHTSFTPAAARLARASERYRDAAAALTAATADVSTARRTAPAATSIADAHALSVRARRTVAELTPALDALEARVRAMCVSRRA